MPGRRRPCSVAWGAGSRKGRSGGQTGAHAGASGGRVEDGGELWLPRTCESKVPWPSRMMARGVEGLACVGGAAAADARAAALPPAPAPPPRPLQCSPSAAILGLLSAPGFPRLPPRGQGEQAAPGHDCSSCTPALALAAARLLKLARPPGCCPVEEQAHSSSSAQGRAARASSRIPQRPGLPTTLICPITGVYACGVCVEQSI